MCISDPGLVGSPDALTAQVPPQPLGADAEPHVPAVRRVRRLQHVRVPVPKDTDQHAARQLPLLHERCRQVLKRNCACGHHGHRHCR